MSRRFMLTLTFALALVLAACGPDTGAGPGEPTDVLPTTELPDTSPTAEADLTPTATTEAEPTATEVEPTEVEETATPATDEGSPTPATDTGAITDTDELTGTNALTGTDALTGTEALTGTDALTGTEALTGTDALTGTEALTGTGDTAATGDSLLEAVEQDGRFTILLAALEASGVADRLEAGGPYTLFAPTDQAFASMPTSTIDQLTQDPDMLTQILTYHVAQGKVLSADLEDGEELETLQGEAIEVTVEDGDVMLNNTATVTTTAEIETDNVVIYPIDEVLLPPGTELSGN